MPELTIPFLSQPFSSSDRRCGAAALAMVYGSLGMSLSQEAIWEAIAGPSRQGPRTAQTYRLARHALEQGLAAIAFQAAEPWTTLVRCWEAGLRVIVNHRLRSDSRLGHFSVLAGLQGEAVLLHDPQVGPGRRLPRPELLRLWLPTSGGCEIVGNVLVAIARQEAAPPPCYFCQVPHRTTRPCPACGKLLELAPMAALGCLEAACPARRWKHVFCPHCDGCLPTEGQSGMVPPCPKKGS